MTGFRHSALAIVAGALASVLAPPESISPSAWTAANLIVPDGPRAGELWDPALTPYLVEPLDALGPDSPVNKIVIRKSAQTGFTTLGLGWIGHTIACDPCRMAVVQPTDSALSDFLRDKLNVAIDETPALKRLVADQKSRSSAGSTTYAKRYPGGALSCLIASSTSDLRSKTVKKLFKDEASEYPDDLDGQGSPHGMLAARYESFRASGDWKELNISTPVLKGACWIDAEFEAGDQRYWHVACPHCRHEFYFDPTSKYFQFNPKYPFEAHYVCPECGSVITAPERSSLVRAGRWIATAPAPGKFRSYHFDALSSLLVPWDVIAERIVAAGDDPSQQKTLWNLSFGRAYEMRSDTPDHAGLMQRRDRDLKRGVVPPEALLLVGAADVQGNGIWVEILGLAPDRQSFVVDVLFLDGDTDDPERGAFAKLSQVFEREYVAANGKTRRVDLFGVDSGFRSHVVYTWCRKRPGALALDGRDGWSLKGLGTPKPMDINLNGKRTRNGVMLYPVGTWSLKGTFYSDLRKGGARAGAEVDPPGYCHFGDWLDEAYFKQLTAEYLADETLRSGRRRKAWKVKTGQPNHLLDCRIYNMALAYHLGLDRMTREEWLRLARHHGAPEGLFGPDMFAPLAQRLASEPIPAQAAAEFREAPEPPPAALLEQDGDDWLSRHDRDEA